MNFIKCIGQLVVLVMLFTCNSYAQNIVPNPSFEDYNTCPATFTQFPSGYVAIAFSPAYSSFPTVKNWVTPSSNSSSDYFNVCGGFDVYVPFNRWGYQLAHTGKAYTGMYTELNANGSFKYGEYVQARLLQPMQAGHRYYLSFYVSNSGMANTPASFQNKASMDNIGMMLTNSIIATGTLFLTGTPAIKNTPGNILEDTANWVKISGVYTATGGEQWVTIGSFDDGIPVQYKYQGTPNTSYTTMSTYRYVDDVFVMDMINVKSSFKDTTICPSSLPMKLQGKAVGDLYVWNTHDSTQTITINDTGLYYVETWKDTVYSVDSIHVRYENLPKLDIGNDTTYCDVAAVVIAANSDGYHSYLWNTGATTFGIKVTQSGTYILKATSLCDTVSDTIHIAMLTRPTAPVVRDTTICKDQPAPLLDVPGEDIRWYNGNGNLLSTGVQPEINTSNLGSQTLYLSQTNKCGESDKQPLHIEIIGGPSVSVLQQDTTLCMGAYLQLNATVSGGQISWNTGGATCCINVNESGTYVATATNACGAVSDSVTVNLSNCDKCVWLPDAFTPNGDGRNDYFHMVTICPIKEFSLVIVNRWGQTVFQSDDVKQQWDGTYQGAPAEMGAYFYVLKTTPRIAGSTAITIQGDVTLIR